MKRPIILSIVITCLCVGRAIAGDDPPTTVNYTTSDVAGKKVSVPAGDRISIVAFVRADQPQSADVMQQIRQAVADNPAQVIVVFTGEHAAEQAKSAALLKTDPSWPIVTDPDFSASGKLNVHVWPTTVVVDRSGKQIAHLAGLSASFANDLHAYLDAADQKIDASELKVRLANHDVVTSGPAHVAARHLQVARRMLEDNQVEQAQKQIEEGLNAQPDDVALRLLQARVLLIQNRAADALGVIDKLPAAGWQTAVLRTRALICLDKWDDAKTAAADSLKLNPEPAEAHYLMGLISQHESDWAHAAESFRLAFESTSTGKLFLKK